MYKQDLKVEFGAKEGGSCQPFKLAGLEYGFLGIFDFLGIVQSLERETKCNLHAVRCQGQCEYCASSNQVRIKMTTNQLSSL